MIDHLEIGTQKMQDVADFYSVLLEPLGYSLVVDTDVKGFGAEGRLDFFIVKGPPSADVHYAFAAPDRATVDRIYRLGEERGLQLDRPPALAPHVHPNYYAGYLRDPDGRLVEFVCQKAE